MIPSRQVFEESDCIWLPLTVQSASKSIKVISAEVPLVKFPESNFKIEAGPLVRSSMVLIKGICFEWNNDNDADKRVSIPKEPGFAIEKGSILASLSWGTWSEEIASIVPSLIP